MPTDYNRCPLHPRFDSDSCPKCVILSDRNPKWDRDTGIPAFPTLIRRETGLMEFLCEHGVGHPAKSSAHFMDVIHETEPGVWSTHGCDGCCSRDDFPDAKYTSPRIVVIPQGE